MEDPHLSIDKVAREVKDRYPQGVDKAELTRIRTAVRERINNGHGYNDERPAPDGNEKEDSPQTATLPSAEERKAWLVHWADENPMATIAQASDAAKKEFGVSFSNQFLTDSMRNAKAKRAARIVAAIEPDKEQISESAAAIKAELEKRAQPQEEPVSDERQLARLLAKLKVKRIELTDEGYAFEYLPRIVKVD